MVVSGVSFSGILCQVKPMENIQINLHLCAFNVAEISQV